MAPAQPDLALASDLGVSCAAGAVPCASGCCPAACADAGNLFREFCAFGGVGGVCAAQLVAPDATGLCPGTSIPACECAALESPDMAR